MYHPKKNLVPNRIITIIKTNKLNKNIQYNWEHLKKISLSNWGCVEITIGNKLHNITPVMLIFFASCS